MATIEIKIPQLGEGLQEARLIRFLKQTGESVAKDEPIYEMETDKAILEIESPVAGVMESWGANEDDVLPIGAVVGRIATVTPPEPVGDKDTRLAAGEIPVTTNGSKPPLSLAGAQAPEDVHNSHAVSASPKELVHVTAGPGRLRNGSVPPRTRGYARERGVGDTELARLAQHVDGKLMPQSVDAYLEGRRASSSGESVSASAIVSGRAENREGLEYRDLPLSQPQRMLVHRLQRSAQAVIPATMEIVVNWNAVEAVRAEMRVQAQAEGDRPPSQFLLFAWCVAQAAKVHPSFRSALVTDISIREYAHLHLGIAVARPGDELLMARVLSADTLGFREFVSQAQAAIDRARDGEDQTAEAMQISISNMSAAGVRTGIPVVVAPAAGTLFIGAPYDQAYPLPGGGAGFRRSANMVFTFDHRIANGIGAARFVNDIQARLEGLKDLLEV